MMRSMMFAVSVMLAAAAGVSHSVFAADSTVLKPLYEQYFKAYTTGNLDGIMSYIDPNAVFIDEKGVSKSAAQYREVTRTALPKIRNFRINFALKDVRTGDRKVTVQVQQEAHLELLVDEAGKWMPVVMNQIDEEEWEYKNGTWKIVVSKTIASQALPDAAAIVAQKPAPAAPNTATQKPAAPNNPAQGAGAQDKVSASIAESERLAEVLKEKFGAESAEYALALKNVAMRYSSSGRAAQGEAPMRQVIAIDEKRNGAGHPAVAEDLNTLALILKTADRNADAEPVIRRALAIDEKATGPEHPNVARDLKMLGEILQAANRLTEAEPVLRQALAINEKLFGPNDPKIADAVYSLGALLLETDHFDEAEAMFRKVLAIEEKANGPNHLSVGRDLNSLAMVLRKTNRLVEAEPLIRRSNAIFERFVGADHPVNAVGLVNLATVLQELGRLNEVEPMYRRALAILEKTTGPESSEMASVLGNMASYLHDVNRYAEAEQMMRRALAIDEKVFGPDHTKVALRLNNLAIYLYSTNSLSEAEPLFRRTLAIYEKSYGPEHTDVAHTLGNLAQILQDTKRRDEAEPLMRRALAIDEKNLGPDHPTVATDLNNLAGLLHRTDRFAEAEPLYRRTLAIFEKSYGPGHNKVAIVLNNIARLLVATHRHAEAEPLLRRALAIDEKTLSPGHPDMAVHVFNLALLHGAQADWRGAMETIKRAAAMDIANARRLRSNSGDGEKRLLSHAADTFKAYVLMAFRAAPTDASVRDEAFAMAQRALLSDAAGALAQASARFAAGSGTLAVLVRTQQDAMRDRDAADKRLLAALGKGDNAAAEAARQEQVKLDAKLDTVAAQLAREFPDYAALTSPEPLSIAAVQALLAPDEALVLFLDVKKQDTLPETGFAWAITKTEVRWVELPLGREAIAGHVAALRCGLDPAAWDGDGAANCQKLLSIEIPRQGKPMPFDLGRAHALYQALFGQFANLIEGKRLLIAPSGALTALPFQVLVTDKPATAIPGTWQAYRGVNWLGRKTAITVLPSVTSVKAMRTNTRASQAQEPFVGFGDPALLGNPHCGKIKVPADCPGDNVGQTPGEAAPSLRNLMVEGTQKYFRGGLGDVVQVRKLCPLPDTAHELKCVAKSLSAPSERIVIGKAASETAVKKAQLNRYRVVHFATHGLLSNESSMVSEGLAEPALVLTPPDTATSDDDGLLTASEVTQLRLDADWVVLSACNTAGGAKPDAEALSGLARAFFYAGARTLLVSHWPVDSNAATTITSTAFQAQRDAPRIGPSEALRRSIATLMDDGRIWYAHPSYWAPFVVVGGGR